MKHINESLQEALNEAAVEVPNFTKQMPKNNQEEYLVFSCSDGKFFRDVTDVYVNVKDLAGNGELYLQNVAYNIAKSLSPKYTYIEIGELIDDKLVTFAISSLRKNNRMWHPEWIKQENIYKAVK